MKNRVHLKLAAVAFVIAFSVCFLASPGIARPKSSGKHGNHDWPIYGGTTENNHFSPLPNQSQECEAPAGGMDAGNATPITYQVHGHQFVVIAASGGKDLKSKSGGVYVAFAVK